MTAPIRAPLAGELLDDASVRVVCALHPFRAEVERFDAPAGLSVAEIVDRALEHAPRSGLRRSILASIGSDPVPAERWRGVRLKPGAVLVLRAVPGKGGGSLFKSLAMLAVVILTAIVAPYITPILGTFGTALLTTAISVGAGYLLNSLFPAKDKSKDTGTSYAIAGNQNLLAKYGAVPALHGRMRVYPIYAASPYTEFAGEDQILRLLFAWAYMGAGGIQVDLLKIGETPLSAYRDVEVQHRLVPSDPMPTLYPSSVIQLDLNVELKNVDGWTIRTTSDEVTEWAVDIIAPNGLYATRKSGAEQEHTVEIEVEQAPANTEAWAPVEVVSMTAVSTKPIRRTVRRPVARGTYDIRVKRRTMDFDGSPNITSTTAWSALRSYRSEPPVRFAKGIAVTAVRIKATSQLSGVVDNFNGVATAMVRAFEGGAWIAGRPSRAPADHFAAVLQGPANARPAPDSRIDWAALQSWKAWTDPRGYTYDRLVSERQSVLEMLQEIAAAGRAAVVLIDGLWSVVWDDPAAPVVQHFSPRNSTGFRGRRSYRRLPHAWRVRFQNALRGYRDDEVTVYADGYDVSSATLIEQIEFAGITDRTQAWKMGRYHDAQIRLRPEEYELNVDIEHLVGNRPDRVRVSHPVPAWGLSSGRVAGVAGAVLQLDETVAMQAGRSYCIRLRLADGTSLVRNVLTAPGEGYAVTVTGTGALPAVGDLWAFGELGTETAVLRIKAIRPGQDLSARLILVDDAPGIATADAGAPPPADTSGGSTDPTSRVPTNLRVVEDLSGDTPRVTFLWDTPGGGPPVTRFEVALKAPGSSAFGSPITVPAAQRSYGWTGLPAGLTGFQVQTFFSDASASAPVSTSQTLVSWSGAPPAVTGLRADVYAGRILLSWDAPARIVARTELRYTAATGGATWAGAAALVSRSDATSIDVPFAAGSYLARHVNGGGTASADTAIVVVTGPATSDATVVGEVFDYSPFGGTHTNTVEANAGVQLVTASGAVVASGTYQPTERVDLDAVYAVRLSGEVIAHGREMGGTRPDIYDVDPGAWSAIPEYRTTRDNPASSSATWTDWTTLATAEVEARSIAVRVRLLSFDTGVTPVVELVRLRVEMDPRIERIPGLAVPTAGRAIAFDPAFAAVPAIVATIRDQASGDRMDWTARTAAGVTLVVRDSGGSAVARTVDLIASGYGRRRS